MTLDLDHFRERVLQDALTEALRSYWLRRARAFADAGRHDIAVACARHSTLVEFQDVDVLDGDELGEAG